MIRLALALALVAASGAARAITPVSQAVGMAIRAGEVVGAAAACGVPEGRLIAVGKTVIALVREVARTGAELRQAQAHYERAAARGEAEIRHRGEGACPAAIAAFERAEAN